MHISHSPWTDNSGVKAAGGGVRRMEGVNGEKKGKCVILSKIKSSLKHETFCNL